MNKKLGKVIALTGLVVLLSGCGKVPVLPNGEEAIFKLNNKDVAVTTLYEALKDKYGVTVLVDVVDKMILEEKYPADSDEEAKIQEDIDYVKSYAEQNNASVTDLLEYYYGVSTIDEFKKILSLDYKRNLAVEDYVKSKITDKEIKKYYDSNIKGDINAKHILIAPETAEGMTDDEIKAQKDAALKTAKSIIKKLKDGEKWDDLAKKYSDDDSNASKGGDLGWFNTGEMEESFEKAAYALKKGTYSSTPVETQYGYHIIYKVDEKEKPKLEEVKEDIIEEIMSSKLDEDTTLRYEALKELRKSAGFEIYDDKLSSAYKDYLKIQEK